jgi:hypothetical protein
MWKAIVAVLGPWVLAVVPAALVSGLYLAIRHPGGPVPEFSPHAFSAAVCFLLAWLAYGMLGAVISFRWFTRDDGPAPRDGSG